MLEGYKKKVSDVETAEKVKKDLEAGIVKKPAPKTLNEILKDPNDSAFLGRVMEIKNDKELAARMATGTLEQSDLEKLEVYRLENIEKLEQVKSLETAITPEYVKDFAANSPEFQKLVNLVGPEKAAKSIQSQLREVAASDGSRFENMHDSLKKLSEYKGKEMKDLEKKIREQCKGFKTNLKEEDFAAVMAISDPMERADALQEKVRGSFGLFRKAADYVSLGKFSRPAAEELAKNKTQMDATIKGLNEHIGNMGGTLNAMISENADVRKAFAKELIDEKAPVKTPEVGFESVRKEVKDIDTAWTEFRTANNFYEKTDVQQETLKKQFRTEAKESQVKKPAKKGIWARLWSSIFEKAIDNKELN